MVFKKVIYILLLITSLQTLGQTEIINIGGTTAVRLTSTLPESLTSERCLVIISMPPVVKNGISTRDDWQKLTEKTHKIFRKIGIDAIAYVYLDDLNAGPEVNYAYLSSFQQRAVKNLILLEQQGTYPKEQYRMLVTSYEPASYIAAGQDAWQDKDAQLENLMYRLGKQVLRQGIERSNFLIPEKPDYMNSLSIFSGSRLENYPSRIKSNKLAVVAFQKVTVDPDALNVADLKAIESYNKSIDLKNEELKAIFESYPYKFDVVEASNDEELFDMGYQYALLPMTSTAKSIRDLLEYKSQEGETFYTTSYKNGDQSDQKNLPVNANVTKYYIKQTVVKDIHVGKVWDADTDWQTSLQNFLFYLTTDLK